MILKARRKRIDPLLIYCSLLALFVCCAGGSSLAREPAEKGASGTPTSLAGAMSYIQANNWEKAVSSLRQLVESHPAQGDAWFWLGYAQYRLHQFAKATYAFQHAASIGPQSARTFYFLGLGFLEMGRPYKAYQAWITTIRLDPNKRVRSAVSYYIGRLIVDEGRLLRAEKWLKQVDPSSPVSYRATYWLGFCNEKLGNSTEAIQLYQQSLRQCIRANTAFSAPYIRLAKLLMRIKRMSDAKEVLEEGLRLAPDGELLTEYGKFLIQEHEDEKAQLFLIRASRMDPSLPSPHYVLGRLLTRLGEKSKAQQEYKVYQQLKSQQLSAWEKRHLFHALQYDKYIVMRSHTTSKTGSPVNNRSQVRAK